MPLFTREMRLRRAADFRRVFDRRCKAGDGVLLCMVDRCPDGVTRLGLSVGRKHGNAVKRNRIKRLLREAFRLSYDAIPQGMDVVVVPLDARRASLATYRDSLVRLARKAARRFAEAEAS